MNHAKIPLDKVMPQSSSEILSRFPFATVDKSGIDLGCSFVFWGLPLRPETWTCPTLCESEGVDIRLTGEPSLQCGDAPQPKVVAIQPTDFQVDAQTGGQGRSPSAGRRRPVLRQNVHFGHVCEPVSGTVKEVVRGAKRRILAVTVESDGSGTAKDFGAWSEGDRDALVAHMAAGCIRHREAASV